MDLTTLALPWLCLVFALAALCIGIFGVRLTTAADRLADMTGMGEALMGGLFLGGITSLPGSVASVVAAMDGHASLAFSNAVGGIAAQTVFLAVADMAYRKANLEHAASSLPNLLQSALLVTLLALPLLAMTGPEVTILGVHPVSYLLFVAYGFGMKMVSHVQKHPLWAPRMTEDTRTDKPDTPRTSARGTLNTRARFLGFGAVVGFAGYVVAKAGVGVSIQTGVSETLVGMLLTSICTSLPELITSVAAVRRGALTLAVGGIIGGNCFDVLFLSFSDVAYRGGSIYHAVGSQQTLIIALCILLTGILLMGLLRRERHGIANIGFESMLIVVSYVCALALLVSS